MGVVKESFLASIGASKEGLSDSEREIVLRRLFDPESGAWKLCEESDSDSVDISAGLGNSKGVVREPHNKGSFRSIEGAFEIREGT